MSEPFVAEIKIFAGNFAPRGYALCNGQIMPISQNTALFSLIGTNYGGNGTSNFALPNLQGAVPVGSGQGLGLSPWVVGETQGAATHTLTSNEVPSHQHSMRAYSNRSGTYYNTPKNGSSLAASQGGALYAPANKPTPMNPGAVPTYGGSQPHNNMMPGLALSFVIALQGIFPARN
ncbi:MAG: phage tail protein [Proteobacteria bacterium]|nr:phage tail protein [Pseudomonadota bacterium]